MNHEVEERSECAIRSFADRKPFFVRYPAQSSDYDSSRSDGVAGDANGNVFVVEYGSTGWAGYHLPNGALLFDDKHIIVIPCPKPVAFRKIGIRITCADSISVPME